MTPFRYGAVRLKAASVRLCIADHGQAQDCTRPVQSAGSEAGEGRPALHEQQ